MPEPEAKDELVTLINFDGKEEQVWDFANHVDELLSKGWSRREGEPAGAPRTIKGTPGPELIIEQKTEETE